ncbi:MAG: nucleotidyltransferase domain-containing protein [Planctomycetota bacterium]
MSETPLPAAVQGLLAWWLPRAEVACGDALRAMLLYGSVVLGDFQAGWSDVDVCAVLREPPSRTRERCLAELHHATELAFVEGREGPWSSGQTVDLLVLYAAHGDLDHEHVQDAFDQLGLATRTRVLAGESVTIAHPDRDALSRRSMRLEQEACSPPEGASAIWYAAVLQLLARAVVFWRDGELVSKTRALLRLIEERGQVAEAFELALRVRRGGSATAARHTDELRGAHAVATPWALDGLADWRRCLP